MTHKKLIFLFGLVLSLLLQATILWSFYRNHYKINKLVLADSVLNEYKNNSSIHLLLCSDKQHRLPLWTLINSIIQNEKDENRHRLNFNVLIDDIKDINLYQNEFKAYFQQYPVNITIKSIQHTKCQNFLQNVTESVPKIHIHRLVKPMNFARFCFPDLFENVQVGIYMDVDMIVQTHISQLYDEYYYKNNYIVWSIAHDFNQQTSRTFKRLLYEENKQFITSYFTIMSNKYESVSIQFLQSGIKKFFNAGLVMYSLDIWRKYNFTQQTIDLYHLNSKYAEWYYSTYNESKQLWFGITQPIINLLFTINDIEYGELLRCWNKGVSKKNGTKDYLRTIEKQNIIHWPGTGKPYTLSYMPSKYLWIKYVPHTKYCIVDPNITSMTWEKNNSLIGCYNH